MKSVVSFYMNLPALLGPAVPNVSRYAGTRDVQCAQLIIVTHLGLFYKKYMMMCYPQWNYITVQSFVFTSVHH